MFDHIDISSYLRPAPNGCTGDHSTEADGARPPKHDPTYSAVFGYGWGKPKLLKPKPNSKEDEH